MGMLGLTHVDRIVCAAGGTLDSLEGAGAGDIAGFIRKIAPSRTPGRLGVARWGTPDDGTVLHMVGDAP